MKWLLICLTVLELRNIECKAYCRAEGFSKGYYERVEASCACIRLLDYEALSKPKFTLTMKPEGKDAPKEEE